jgi:hypothetical protein
MTPFAHIAGMPVEETIGSLGPALALTLAAASATLRARWRGTRSAPTHDAPRATRAQATRARRALKRRADQAVT